jgi:hypothetical protein
MTQVPLAAQVDKIRLISLYPLFRTGREELQASVAARLHLADVAARPQSPLHLRGHRCASAASCFLGAVQPHCRTFWLLLWPC